MQIMAPSHDLGIRKDDELTRALETNEKKIPCPECRSHLVTRSSPLLRPFTKEPRFKPIGLLFEYTCEACMNWWTAE